MRRWAPLLGLGVVVLLGFGLTLRIPANEDVAWYLTAGERLAAEGGLYEGTVVDVNPPLILWWSTAAAAVASALGVATEWTWWAFVVGCGLLSAFLCSRLVPSGDRGRWLVVLAVLFVLLAGRHFGQREHLMVVLATPYLFLVGRRWGESRPSPTAVGNGFAAVVGLAAAAGWCLKPPALVVLLGLEFALVVRHRTLSFRRRPELAAVVLATTAYGAAALIGAATYFSEVVPHLVAAYSGLGSDLRGLLLGGHLWLLAAAAVLVVLSRKHARRPLVVALAVATLGYLLLYLGQGKGWAYHRLPMLETLAVLALAALLPTRDAAGSGRSWPRRLLGGAVLLSALWGIGGYTWWGLVKGGDPTHEAVVERLKADGVGGTVYVLSTRVGAGFPLVRQLGAEWPSRFPCLWPLPSLVPEPTPAAVEAGTAMWMLDALAEDLERRTPDWVLVDRRSVDWFPAAATFDYFAHLSRHPGLEPTLDAYRRQSDVGHYEVWKRHGA